MEGYSTSEVFYCIFWYPTLFHGRLTIRSNYVVKDYDISDSDKPEEKHLVSINLLEEGNLRITSKFVSEEESRIETAEILLERISPDSDDGFVQYKALIKKRPLVFDVAKYKRTLCRGIYHLCKGFYHEHETNQERDSALPGCLSDQKIDIEKFDNNALGYYLSCYEDVFNSYAKEISGDNRLLEKLESKQPLSTYSFANDTKTTVIEKVGELNKKCENALIEYAYCKTLLTSLRNKSFHHDAAVDFDGEEDERKQQIEHRNTAQNIRNAVRYIEAMRHKNQVRLSVALSQMIAGNVAENKKMLKKGDVLAHLSVFVSIISLYVALAFGIKDYVVSKYSDTVAFGYWVGVILVGTMAFIVSLLVQKRKDKIPQST